MTARDQTGLSTTWNVQTELKMKHGLERVLSGAIFETRGAISQLTGVCEMMKVNWRAAVVVLVGAVVLPVCGAMFLPLVLPPLWRLRHGASLSNGGITVTLKGGWIGNGIPDGVRLSKPSWEGKLTYPLSVRVNTLVMTTVPKCLDEAAQDRVLSGTLKHRRDGGYANVEPITLVAGGNIFRCTRSESVSDPKQAMVECTTSQGNAFVYLAGHDADIREGLGIVGSVVVALKCF
jgi:hypothetical protein